MGLGWSIFYNYMLTLNMMDGLTGPPEIQLQERCECDVTLDRYA